MDPIKIGKYINNLRKEHNMSQSELASILNVTSQAVSKWENGRGIPDVEMLKRLSEVFKVNIDEILSGEDKEKNNTRNIIYFSLLVLIVIAFGIFLKFRKDDTFYFTSLASDNDAFTIRGVMAYTKNKKSIYISEVHKTSEDEEKYKSMECILYESNNYVEKIISKYGDVNNEKKDIYSLTELLKEVEFNIDNYECGCTEDICDNLFLRINVKTIDNKIITYQIPIQLDSTCEAE